MKAIKLIRQTEEYKKAFKGASIFNPNEHNKTLSNLYAEALKVENEEWKKEKEVVNGKIYVEGLGWVS